MGWLIWLGLTALCVVAAYAASAAWQHDRSSVDRALGAALITPAVMLVPMQLVGYVGQLRPLPLALVSLACAGALLAIALHARGLARLLETARHDLRAPVRALADVWPERDPSVLAVIPAAAVFVASTLVVLYSRSWTWDGLWYHVPITHFAVQDGTLAWTVTDDHFIQGYPRNVELLAAWNCIFPRDNRLEDSSQLGFGILGALAVAAWARRLGASRPLALGVGAGWIAIPPVFLELPTTYVDVACAALLIAAVYHLSRGTETRDRHFALLALGLYVGTKATGVFHFALLAPWIAAGAAWQLWHARGRRLVIVAGLTLSLVLFASVGVSKYVQNAVVMGNPFYPFETRVPLTHTTLPGPEDVAALYDAPRGSRMSFFGQPGDWNRLLTGWQALEGGRPTVDVRGGGFGPAWRWLLLWCAFAVFGDAIRGRALARNLPVVVLFVIAFCVPAAYWARYTLAGAAAGLVAYALVASQQRRRLGRILLGVLFVALVARGVWDTRPGTIAWPYPGCLRAIGQPAEVRESLDRGGAEWPQPMSLRRETELREGDVVAYDESTLFLGEYFSHDYRSRVVYVPSDSSPDTFVARLQRLRARWAGVRRGSRAAMLLERAGGRCLLVDSASSTDVWEVPPMTRGHR